MAWAHEATFGAVPVHGATQVRTDGGEGARRSIAGLHQPAAPELDVAHTAPGIHQLAANIAMNRTSRRQLDQAGHAAGSSSASHGLAPHRRGQKSEPGHSDQSAHS